MWALFLGQSGQEAFVWFCAFALFFWGNFFFFCLIIKRERCVWKCVSALHMYQNPVQKTKLTFVLVALLPHALCIVRQWLTLVHICERACLLLTTHSLLSLSFRDKAPGQRECDFSIDGINRCIRDIEQASLAAVSQSLATRDDISVEVREMAQEQTEQCSAASRTLLLFFPFEDFEAQSTAGILLGKITCWPQRVTSKTYQNWQAKEGWK